MCEHGADELGEQPRCTTSFPSSPALVCQLWGAWWPSALRPLPPVGQLLKKGCKHAWSSITKLPWKPENAGKEREVAAPAQAQPAAWGHVERGDNKSDDSVSRSILDK